MLFRLQRTKKRNNMKKKEIISQKSPVKTIIKKTTILEIILS